MNPEIVALIVGNVVSLIVAATNLVAFFRIRAENNKLRSEAGKVDAETQSIKTQADEVVFQRLIKVIDILESDLADCRSALSDCLDDGRTQNPPSSNSSDN